jgi:sugar/nucleoside kinase (ribokinase family)
VTDPAADGPPHVVVVGDVMTDVVARMSGPLAGGSDTPSRISTYGGGSAANTAAWLAAAGARVTLVGRRGDDALGEAAERALVAAGVRTCLAVDPDRPTGTCVVIVDPSGERTMLPDRGANAALSSADLPAAVFAPGRHLHLSGYVVLETASRAAGEAALAMAASAGMTASVDPSSAAPLRAMGASAFVTATAGAGLCMPNLDEAEVLTGTSDPEAAARAVAAAYGEAVVTLGIDGSVWSDGATVARAPAVPVAAVDSTGAGDAFAAGFLASRLAGRPPSQSLAAGARLAAQAVSAIGGRPVLVTAPDARLGRMGG